MKNNLFDVRDIANFREMVNNGARLFGDLPAFRVRGDEGEYSKEISFKEFRREVNGLGSSLCEINSFDGYIGIISENRYEWCLSYLTVGCGGGVAVPIDKELPAKDIHMMIKVSGLKTIIYSQAVADKIMEAYKKNDTDLKTLINMDIEEDTDEELSFEKLLRSGKEVFENGYLEFAKRNIDPEKLGILVFTSGTTDNAKAVMLSQKNICADVVAIRKSLYSDTNDSILSILPLHHTYECTAGFLVMYSSGVTIGFCKGIKYISSSISEYKPTIIMMVPAILENIYKKVNKAIAAKPEMARKVALGKKICALTGKVGIDISKKIFRDVHSKLGGRVRLIICGAAPVNPEALKGFGDMGVCIRQGYGLTETSPIVTVNDLKNNRNGSIGLPLCGMQVEILNPDENGIGELAVKGDNVMLGYYKDSEATAKVFRDGWFLTGDLGYTDKDGFIYLTGRSKNVIVTKNGKNIYPEELEELVSNLPYVKDCMISGVPDLTQEGELIITLQILPDPDYCKENAWDKESSETVIDKIWPDIKEINKKVAPYKRIRSIILRQSEFEKTTTQKVKRYADTNIIKNNKE